MLGLSLEKLIVIAVIAAVVIGPERLPQYASRLAGFVRSVRDFTASMKARAESDLGVPLDTEEWNRQIRRYDPRVIVKEALQDTTPEPEPALRQRWVVVGGTSGHPLRRRVPEPVPDDEQAAEAPTEPVTTESAALHGIGQ